MNGIKEMDKALLKLVHQFIPTKEYQTKFDEMSQKIFRLLQTKSKFKVDRPYIAGSQGKKATIMSSDIDLVVFVNDEEPPFGKVIKDFHDVLLLSGWSKLSEPVETTERTVRFVLDGFEIDLLPAPNYVNKMEQQPGMPILGARQALQVFKKIEQARPVFKKVNRPPHRAYDFSSGLCESSLEFMRLQTSLTHEVARLAKLWNKTIHIDGFNSGRSSFVELVAVYAAQKEEKKLLKEDRSLLSGFQTFLTLMVNFQQLKIEFDFDPLKPIETEFPPWTPQPPASVKTCPYVIDPCNPYNNRVAELTQFQMTTFSKMATETLNRLRNCFDARGLIPLDKVFEPQPSLLPYLSERQKIFFQTAKFQVTATHFGSTMGSSTMLPPTMVIRREDKYSGVDMKFILKKMQDFFAIASQTFVNSLDHKNDKDNDPSSGRQGQGPKGQEWAISTDEIRSKLVDRMTRCIDQNVFGASQSWAGSAEPRENYDVNFDIPCQGSRGVVCVYISFRSK